MVQKGEISSSVSSTAETFCLDDASARCAAFPELFIADYFLPIWNLKFWEKFGFEFARGYDWLGIREFWTMFEWWFGESIYTLEGEGEVEKLIMSEG